ncbi:heat shock protein HspQ [Opitutales bacterium]|nr:heat shock protein HspQ [Opitutales bacterium]
MIRVINEQSPDRNSLSFKTGDIINHKTYGYRGVIAHKDSTFKGDEQWYLSNQSQPSKHQPWYFVLVDEIQQVTYVAESNLSLDRLGKKVDHAMINLFFSEYDNELKKYIRNEVPWNPGNPPETRPPSSPPNFQPHDKPPNFTLPDPPGFH